MKNGDINAVIEHVIWEPQLRPRLFRRGPWEHTAVVETSASGALIEAHANRAIRTGTRVSIALGAAHGLVTVRRVDPSPNPRMSYYDVEFVWLDQVLRARFEDAVSIAVSGDIARRGERTTGRTFRDDVISLR